jgi:mediator of RNA polymerase II transcription subunit 12
MQPLQLKLDTLIRSLVLAVPEAFVSMADVQPHGIIHRRSQKPDLDLTKMGMIGKVQVDPTALCDCLLSSQTWQQQLLALLDTTPFAPIPTDLAERCWMSGGDGRALVTLMLDWCTSPIRHGVARLFLVGEILQSWHKTRFVDVTSLIIHYIDARSLSYTPKDDAGDRSRSPIDPDRSLYKLISILAASGAFSAPRYIQWLIAHGLVLTTMDISFSGPCLTRLLVEIPESTLTSAVQRLRATILARNMLDGGEPRRLVAETLYLAGLATGSYLPHPPLMPLTDQTLDRLANPCELIDSQSCRQTSLDIVCDRLRLGSRSLQVHVSTTVAAAFKSWVRSQKDSCIKLSFSAVRAILEAAADYSALADIIHTMAPSSSIPTLMVCVDAVCMNLDVFKALGRVGLLHTTLSKRWNIVASDGQSDASIKPTIAALGLIAEQLYNPSPAIGDNMYDPYVSIRRSCEHHPTLPSDSSYLRDQQARLQRCGTNQVVLGGYGHKGQPRIDLNENSRISTAGDETNAYNNVKTLARPHSLQYPPSDLLNSMIAQFETYWTEGAHYEVKRLHACQLGLLRPRNTALFDQRMSQWITHVRSISSRPHLNGAFPILVAYGCLDVSMLLKTRPFHDTTPQVFQAGYGSPPSSPLSRPFGFKTYHQEALQLLVDSSCVESVLSEEETGCYYMRLRSARILYPSAFLSLIRHAIAEHDKLLGSPRLPPSMLLPLDQTRCQLGILECLRYLIPLHVDEAIRIFAGHGLDLSTITLISRIIIHLLFNGDGDIGVGFWDPVDISAHQLSKTFSDLTLPFCKLKLHLDFLYAQMVDRSKGPAGQKLNILLDELASLIQTAITTDDHDHTLRFVSCAAYGMKLLLSSRLETVLMQMIPMLASCKNFTRHYEHGHRCEAPSDGNIHVAWRIARVLDTFIAKYRLLPQSDVATPTFDAARPNLAAASIGLFKLPDVRSGKTRPRISFRQASVEVWLPLLMQLDSCVVSRITRQSRHTGRAKTSVALHPQSHAHKLNVAKVAPIAPSPNFSTSSCDVTVLIMSAIDRGLTSIGLSGDISYASLSQERLLGVLLDHDHDTLKNAYTNCVRLLQRHAIMRLPSKKPLQALRVSGSASDQRIRYILGYPMTPSPNLVIVSRRKLDILQSLYHQSAGLKGSSYQGLTRLQNQVATRSKKAHRIGRMIQFSPRTWEILNEPTPFMGPNDTTLSLTLFDASKLP